VIVIVASLLVCFLLGFFQPFGIERLNPSVKLYVIVGYTAVTAISTSIIGYLLPYLFKKFYHPSTWTISKSIINNVLIMLLIALGNSIFDWSIRHHLSSTFGSILISYLLVTLLIGFIPALVSIFIVQNNALKKNLHDAMTMNNQLFQRLQNENQINYVETNIVELLGKTKEMLTVYPDSILCLESAGNYVKVSYLLDDIVKHKQIRTTITQIEKDLQNYPYVVRCHRAYMVNVLHIVNVEGNSQGLQLTLRYLKEEVPVSRSYINKIKDKL
jgi:hypothetical protein